ncbi:MAG: flagellar biosynthesis protein FlhB [Legionellales bacterium]
MSEKTETATAYKLQKAKEKGQVSKSTELTTSLSLLVMLGMVAALWPQVLHEIQALERQALYSAAHFQFSLSNVQHLQQFILLKLTNLWLPFAMASGLATVLGTIAQTGLVWSSHPLTPDFKRLGFSQGFKKLFSLKTCFEAAKSTLKLSLAALLLYLVFRHHLPTMLQLALTAPAQDLSFIMPLLLQIMFQLLLLLSVLALIDTWYTRWSYNKGQRMSKQDVKEEYKQKEGDPKIKAKIKQLQYQLRQKTSSLKNIKTADVIITNPTHLAIALKYERGVMPAPKVVCKVQGDLVQQVKATAKKYGIPIIENKQLARTLYQSIELNQWISSDLFPIAASIFKEIYQQRAAI